MCSKSNPIVVFALDRPALESCLAVKLQMRISNRLGQGWKGEGLYDVLTVSFSFTDSESNTLVLKGCSNISNDTCQFLAAKNQTVGEVIF
jgi:hypothetical protein